MSLDPVGGLVKSIVEGGAKAVTGNKSTESAEGTDGPDQGQQIGQAVGNILGLAAKALPILGLVGI